MQQCKEHSGIEARLAEVEKKIDRLYLWIITGMAGFLFQTGYFVVSKILEGVVK